VNYNKLLEGKTAVVTCGDSAAGSAIIRLFAEHGATVAIGAKDSEIGAGLISEIGRISPDSFFIPCDLADTGSVEAFCSEVNRRVKSVHVLVNNPWMECHKSLEDSDEDDDELILQVYQRSIMQTLRAFWTGMLNTGKCAVVNISSASVFKASQGALLHTMANGAVGGMTRVPAVEGGYREVRVNEILAAYGVNASKPADAPLKACGGGYRADVDGVAKAALFLASDMASYVSGVSLSVSGGMQV
jgi:NAD(P)-dependent dehydrogenase (short-subunit alcohol dehydrogenase family)